MSFNFDFNEKADKDFRYYSDAVRAIIGEDKKVYIKTFGCQQNEADSEKLLGLSMLMGYTPTDEPGDADLILVNTCAVREHAEVKAFSMLGRYKEFKKAKPSLIIGLVGCMASIKEIREQLKRSFKYVSFTLPPSVPERLPMMLYATLTEVERLFPDAPECSPITEGVPIERTECHRAYVSIMYGCNNFCTYCIVPYTRGRERSRESREIIAECESLVKGGVKEITLLGQNVNSYRSDIDFASLIEKIALIEGDFVIRFMTSHPKDVPDNLIRVMAKYKGRIAPHFHLPLQSGSDKILKRMNRHYDKARFLSVAKALRENIPDIALTTDIIVGFPGEEDEDFRKTLDILKEVEFDMVYAFMYSERYGTPAAKMPDRLPSSVKEARLAELLALQDKISLSKNLALVGGIERVLVDKIEDFHGVMTATGRSGGGKLVHFPAVKAKIGEMITVEILEAKTFSLNAKEI